MRKLVLLVVVTLGSAFGLYAAFGGSQTGGGGDVPIPPIPTVATDEQAIHMAVDKCALSSESFAEATLTVTVDRSFELVSFSGDFVRESDGVVIGQGFGTLANVAPGQTYTTKVLYSLDAGTGQGGTCHVLIDSVF